MALKVPFRPLHDSVTCVDESPFSRRQISGSAGLGSVVGWRDDGLELDKERGRVESEGMVLKRSPVGFLVLVVVDRDGD